jgi:hypothetical protein
MRPQAWCHIQRPACLPSRHAPEMTPDNRVPDPTMPEPEALARITLDRQLEAAGWLVSNHDESLDGASHGLSVASLLKSTKPHRSWRSTISR